MNSILTNTSSMIALRTLSSTQSSLNKTENAISTGLKVQDASDDASTWAVATSMRTDVSNLQQTSTNLSSAENLLNTALSGATMVASLITSIQAKVTAEANGTENATDIQNDITSLVNQIQNVVSGASYSGVNMLGGNSTNSSTMTFATSVVSDTSGLASVSSVTVNAFVNATAADGGSGAGQLSNLNITNADGSAGGLSVLASFETGGTNATVTATNLQSSLRKIDDLATDVNAIAASLGSAVQNIKGQQTFVNSLVNTLQTGVSNLVDADMTEESARLSALQTQQQLGTQALSIANQAPQMILKLFG